MHVLSLTLTVFQNGVWVWPHLKGGVIILYIEGSHSQNLDLYSDVSTILWFQNGEWPPLFQKIAKKTGKREKRCFNANTGNFRKKWENEKCEQKEGEKEVSEIASPLAISLLLV